MGAAVDRGVRVPRVAPGGATGKARVSPVGGQCPVGYHFNKQDGKYGAARSYCVRNRSISDRNTLGANRELLDGVVSGSTPMM